MVCKKCEKVCIPVCLVSSLDTELLTKNYLQKLSKVAAPDPFTASSDSIKAGTRRVGENKLSKKGRFSVSITSSSCYLSYRTPSSGLIHFAVSGEVVTDYELPSLAISE